MKNNSLTIVISLILAVIFGLLLFCFQVRQTEVALVTRFGKPVRTETEPGLKFKLPWPNRGSSEIRQTHPELRGQTH